MTDFATGSQSCFDNPLVRFVSVNVCGHDAIKQGALPLVADAREALLALHRAAAAAGLREPPGYRAEVVAANRRWAGRMEEEVFVRREGEAMSQGELVHALNQEAKPGDTVIAAAGGAPGDLLKLWDASGGRACHLEFGYSCMGYEIPAALGVRMTQPEGEVYVLIGDGTYLMNPTELVTALQEKLKITVVLSENHGYQCIRRLQMWRRGASSATSSAGAIPSRIAWRASTSPSTSPGTPRASAPWSWRVATEDQLRQALREARTERRSCVIVVETEKHRYLPGGGVWWDVAVAEVSSASETQKLRTEYEQEGWRRQRFHY